MWHSILSRVNWQLRTRSAADSSLADWWMSSRKWINKVDRKSFDSVVILISWSIWFERNARTFNREKQTVTQLVQKITEEAWAWIAGRYRSLLPFVLDDSHY